MSQGFDPDLIRKAAMRDGLDAFVPDGVPEIPVVTEAEQVAWTPSLPDQDGRAADQFVMSGTGRIESPLVVELQAMIDGAVDAYRDTLTAQVRSAIEAQVLRLGDELGRNTWTAPGPGTDVDPRARVTRVGFGKENLEETFAWPGTCCTSDGRSDGSEIVCGHEIRWFFGASVHASGEPHTGFSCESCWTGACDHPKAPSRESGEATFPAHE